MVPACEMDPPRGFEMTTGLAHVESVDHLRAIASDSLVRPKFRLQKLEYRDSKVFELWRTELPFWGSAACRSRCKEVQVPV